MRVIPLPWDSAFFDLKIGELLVDDDQETEDEINSEFDLIYVKSLEKFLPDVKNYSCTYSETKIIFERKDLKREHVIHKSIHSVFTTGYDEADLYELALESGKYSRFNLDPKFSKSQYTSLYRKWIDNSLNGSFADGFLIYKIQEKVVGFVTYRTTKVNATIGLIAISPKHQGEGIGSQLIHAVENKLAETGINCLQIPTQLKNEQACNFYKKLGYSPVEESNINHYWRDPLQ